MGNGLTCVGLGLALLVFAGTARVANMMQIISGQLPAFLAIFGLVVLLIGTFSLTKGNHPPAP